MRSMLNIRGAKVFEIFRKGSTTYFFSSLFFPNRERCDVFRVYAFVRVIDDFVDQKPQKLSELKDFLQLYHKAKNGTVVGNEVIDEFVKVVTRNKIPYEWVDAFIGSMEMDIKKSVYKTMKELEDYMYGSAEVIGLFMAKILRLPKKSYHSAQMLGKAMQLANFVRDISEDTYLGRQYLPLEITRKYGLEDLSKSEAMKNKKAFSSMVQECAQVYFSWLAEAKVGFDYIPRRNLIPIKTATDMYSWTMKQIQKDPFLVFEKKLKPGKARILASIVKNLITT